MNIKVEVDGKKLVINKFVRKVLTSVITSAVSTLQVKKEDPEKREEIGEDWQNILIEIKK
ncbi:hypothetical protein AKJ51_03105 [candidate division MSBL1 archaeon SCGC-AAA382A20]|uniref:Uncharacterized protein n=1 Tax=candidate division MSBL1 archaeon SCGC-AAA382A20 TaxID=1698280 RepID=A0A133VJT4_9EURY|nr:hypothetical protein AKJ51_03105 [candidate division MSBL1 archaeon SCGC-AAA382A20]